MMPAVQIIQGDALSRLREMPAESVQCCVTSPPYWGLRNYGVAGQIGMEKTFAEWLTKMRAVFVEINRVLKTDGTLWVNMGDSYANGTNDKKSFRRDKAEVNQVQRRPSGGLKAKDLVGQPWRLAFALQEDGWYLRRDIIWAKDNPMPETVYDRPSTAHEYIFLLSKSLKYFYDTAAAREPTTGGSHSRGSGINKKIKTPDGWDTNGGGHGSFHKDGREKGKYRSRQNESFSGAVNGLVDDRNWRSVWRMNTEPCKDAHFATFPTVLPRRCIIAGSRPGDTILDPFGGSGTTGQVALELGRNAVLIELNADYCDLIRQRTSVTPGLPL